MKPPILSDRQIPDGSTIRSIVKAQRDADVKWYGKERQGIRIIDEEAISLNKHKELVEQARTEVARGIFEEMEKKYKMPLYAGINTTRKEDSFAITTIPGERWQLLKDKFLKEDE